jgi:metal-sulfur cluster biosynthetic enzyme
VEEEKENEFDLIDNVEVFDMIREINDPEHPLSLEQLRVVRLEDVHVDPIAKTVHVVFTPTIPHCSMATMIGLMIRNKLYNSLSPLYKL